MRSCEREEGVDEARDVVVKLEKTILEVEAKVAGDLVVAGSPRVEPLAVASRSPRDPRFDRRMDVLVTLAKPQPAALRGAQRPP